MDKRKSQECFENFIFNQFGTYVELKEMEDTYNSQKMEFLKDPNEWFNKNKVSSKLHVIFQDCYKNIDDAGFPQN